MTNPLLDYVDRSELEQDAWGTAMCWLFSLAEWLHFHSEEVFTPDAWGYSPPPGTYTLLSLANWDDNHSTWTVEEMRSFDESDILHLGEVLHRYTEILRSSGRSY